jgi:hypothetical protein
VGFDKPRRIQMGTRRFKGRVESFYVTDLDHALSSVPCNNKGLCFGEVMGDGLFDKTMHSASQHQFSNASVHRSWGHDGNRVYGIEKGLDRGKRQRRTRPLSFCSHRLDGNHSGIIGVKEPDSIPQFGKRLQATKVNPAQVASSDNSYAQWGRHGRTKVPGVLPPGAMLARHDFHIESRLCVG